MVRILYLEDNVQLVQMIGGWLESEGYKVAHPRLDRVDDPYKEAIRFLQEEEFNCLIQDLWLDSTDLETIDNEVIFEYMTNLKNNTADAICWILVTGTTDEHIEEIQKRYPLIDKVFRKSRLRKREFLNAIRSCR